MIVIAKREKETHVLHLSGSFNKSANSNFGRAIFEAQLARSKHIILELSNLSSIDSAGLDALFLTKDHLEEKGIRLSLLNPGLSILELLNDTSVPSTLPIYEDEEDLLTATSAA